MRPKWVWWLHSQCTQMLEFIGGFQLVFLALHVVWLPQGFRLTNLTVAGWWSQMRRTRRRPVLHVIRIILVGAISVSTIVVGIIVVGVFFDVGSGLIPPSRSLRFSEHSTPMIGRTMIRSWGRSALPSTTCRSMIHSWGRSALPSTNGRPMIRSWRRSALPSTNCL